LLNDNLFNIRMNYRHFRQLYILWDIYIYRTINIIIVTNIIGVITIKMEILIIILLIIKNIKRFSLNRKRRKGEQKIEPQVFHVTSLLAPRLKLDKKNYLFPGSQLWQFHRNRRFRNDTRQNCLLQIQGTVSSYVHKFFPHFGKEIERSLQSRFDRSLNVSI